MRLGPTPLVESFMSSYCDLLAFLTKRMGCGERASDVLHDVYVRLLSARSVSARNPRAFLFRVARNCAVDELRREARVAARSRA